MEQAATERREIGRERKLAVAKDLRSQGCGVVLGRYTLLRKIAAGGMAEVYAAYAKGVSGFAKKVAIKKILPQHSHNKHFVQMLLDEAKICVLLTHPNITQVYELGLDSSGAYFIVMEYVDGRPLHRVLQRQIDRENSPLPITHAAHIVAEVAKGLDHAHRQRGANGAALSIVHRDVSPQNILLTHQGSVKLIDFGIARAEGRLNQTDHGIIKGKLRYLAPEIAAGREPDQRADIFCAGLVLFELLTGEPMYQAKTELGMLECARLARVRSPRAVNPAVPEELDTIAMRALAREREDRYASAKDLYADLRMFLNRYAPIFNDNELADTMQSLFSVEIAENRELDAIAEVLAGQRAPDGLDDEPTVAVGEWDLVLREVAAPSEVIKGEAEVPKHKVRLAGADGGNAMSIVLASDLAHGKGDGRPVTVAKAQQRKASPATAVPKAPVTAAASGPAGEKDAPPTAVEGAPAGPTVRPPIRDATSRRGWHDPLRITLREGDDENSEMTAGERPEPNASLEARPDASFEAREAREARSDAMALGFADISRGIDRAAPESEVWSAIDNIEIASLEPQDRLELQSMLGSDPASPVHASPPPTAPHSHSQSKIAAALAQPLPAAAAQAPTATIELPADQQPPSQSIIPVPTLLALEGPAAATTLDGEASGPQLKPPVEPIGGANKQLLIALLASVAVSIVLASILLGRDSRDNEPTVIVPINSATPAVMPEPEVVEQPVEAEDLELAAPTEAPQLIEEEEIEPEDDPAKPRRQIGTVLINARPVSTVWINGKKKGRTPMNIQLKPGKHEITLESPDGLLKAQTRKINPGKNPPVIVRWK